MSNTGTRERAVSAVISVVIMVAITILLVALVGTFVFDLGNQGGQAPKAGFESTEQVRFFPHGPSNLTTASIQHTGGDVVDESTIEVQVNGNASTYDLSNKGDTAVPLPAGEIGGDPIADADGGCPPETTCTLESGQSWRVVVYGIDHRLFYDGIPGQTWNTGWGMKLDNHTDRGPFPCCGPPNEVPHGKVLASGDTVRVIWTAESGGKTQTLFKYDVKTGSPDLPYEV